MATLRNQVFRRLRNPSSLRRLTTLSTREPIFQSPVSNYPLRFIVGHGMRTPPRIFNCTSVRWKVSNSNSGSFIDDIGPLFAGCDYEHWLIEMDPPGDGKATKQEMVDCYVKTLATVLGSEEAAIKSIYNVSTEGYFGFGCEISEETSQKLEGLPGVRFVLPDSYVDATNKDYGGELFIDGKIVQRSPERQRLIDAAMYKGNDRPRNNDRTRARRRENQGPPERQRFTNSPMPQSNDRFGAGQRVNQGPPRSGPLERQQFNDSATQQGNEMPRYNDRFGTRQGENQG